MPYTINPQVLINDVEYKDKTIQGISLSNGRNTVDEQPRAGYATITLITPDNTYPEIEIDYRIEVRVDNSNGTDITLWTGWVSDVETTIVNYGSQGWLTQQRITGIGSLAKLNRRLVGFNGYSKEFDGDRVADIIFEGAGTQWVDYDPPTEQWQQVDPLITWNTIDLLIGEIDRPGDFELVAYSGGETNALLLAQQAAQSGLGVLYESNLGRISYDDYTSRNDDIALNGYTTIDNNAILATGLSSISRLSDLINEVEIVYKNNQSELDEDLTSVALYGQFAAKINTLLEKQTDAAQRVEYYLETRAYPRKRLNQVSLALHLDQVSDAMRNALLPMRIGKPVRIEGLPNGLVGGSFVGFVEGFTWTINRNELFLTLNVSEYALSQLAMNWLQVPPMVEWQEVNAGLDWQEARVIA